MVSGPTTTKSRFLRFSGGDGVRYTPVVGEVAFRGGVVSKETSTIRSSDNRFEERRFDTPPSNTPRLSAKGIYYQKLREGNQQAADLILKYYGDVGSEFWLERTTRSTNHPDTSYYGISGRNWSSYKGSIHHLLATESFATRARQDMYWPSEDALKEALFGMGGTAISRANPIKPRTDLALLIAELVREGLPKAVGLSLIKEPSMKGLGEEWLNYNFGWGPIISDVQSLCDTVMKLDKLIRQYDNLSDKVNRRKYSFPDVKSTDRYSISNGLNISSINSSEIFRAPGRNAIVDRSYTQKTWFSGAYRFYQVPVSPNLEDFSEAQKKASYLLGIRITPDVLWELTPWSWLLDYFANIGNVLSNISHIGQDGMTLQYAYIMQHTSIDLQIDTGYTFYDRVSTNNRDPVKETMTVERKVRRKASPYGFGINPTSLTAKQWSILGALGLTLGPRSLRP